MTTSRGTTMPATERGSWFRFTVLCWGCAVSAFGNYLNLVALSLFSYELTGNALATGLFMALRLGSGFLAGLLIGPLTAAVPARTLAIAAELAQATAVVMLIAFPDPLTLWVVAVVLGAGNTVVTVVVRSGIPAMVGQHDRARANGRMVTGRSLAAVLGFGCSALFIDGGGFTAVFAFTAAAFVVAAATKVFVPRYLSSAPRSPDAVAEPRPVWRLLAPVVVGLLVLRCADALGSAAHNVALPVFATTTAPADSAAVMAQFLTAWAVGGMCAQLVVARWLRSAGVPTLAFATCAMSVSFVLAFTGLPSPALIAVSVLAGLADGVGEIAYVSRIQAEPVEGGVRLFGMAASAETAGFAVGMLAASAALTTVATSTVVLIFHGVPFTAALVLLFVARKELGHGGRPARDRLRSGT